MLFCCLIMLRAVTEQTLPRKKIVSQIFHIFFFLTEHFNYTLHCVFFPSKRCKCCCKAFTTLPERQFTGKQQHNLHKSWNLKLKLTCSWLVLCNCRLKMSHQFKKKKKKYYVIFIRNRFWFLVQKKKQLKKTNQNKNLKLLLFYVKYESWYVFQPYWEIWIFLVDLDMVILWNATDTT